MVGASSRSLGEGDERGGPSRCSRLRPQMTRRGRLLSPSGRGGASAVVAVSVDVASGRVLRVREALSWWRGRRARRRLAEDDAPAAAVVPSAVQGLPAQGAGPLDKRRQSGQHDAGECPALLGFGERDSAGLLLGDRGPKRVVVMAALGGGPRLVVGAPVQDPQGDPRRGVDRVVAGEPAEQALQRAVRERGKGLRKRVSQPAGIEGVGRGRRLRTGRGDVRRGAASMDGSKPASMTSWSYWPDLDVHRGGAGRLQVPGPVDAVAGRRCVGGGTRSSGPYRRPYGPHGRRLCARLMTIRPPALARHLPVRLGHHLLE